MKLTGIGRIQLGYTTLCLTAILLANAIGAFPDTRDMKSASRAKLCETLAMSMSNLASSQDIEKARSELEFFKRRNDELVSAGLRRGDGELLINLSDHDAHWRNGASSEGDGCFVASIRGPVGKWGELEMQFKPLFTGAAAYVNPALIKLLLVFLPTIAIISRIHLRRMLQHLDPTRVVPDRVRQTLDNFAEGVLLLDDQDRIVLANEALSAHVRMAPEELVGLFASDLPWLTDTDGNEKMPWQIARRGKEGVHGVVLQLHDAETRVRRVFNVNTTPVLDELGEYRGALAAFADVTSLEQKRSELSGALKALRTSRDEIRTQNEELRLLATRDPLTTCLNRRNFFDQFESAWNLAVTGGRELCCVMADIDFFKSINDAHGHSMGDEVLRQTGVSLLTAARDKDIVCRYGGEEFCIIMPGLNLEDGFAAAEQFRQSLAELTFPGFSVTASLGVSSAGFGAADAQQLLDQADKCLYAAKRTGRNRVVRWDKLPAHLGADESETSCSPASDGDDDMSIPHHAVTALLSSLSFRDAETAAHSTRVADLAGLLAQEVMTRRDAYVVEVAGLLHDIGKIGVPDSILLKPGALSEDEWKIMARHDRIGVEIINSSFKCPALTDIVANHHRQYGGDATLEGDLPVGDEIPIGARIVSIADAYDAMASDRPYRKGIGVDRAILELRACAGTQFDPDLVEIFCGLLHTRKSKPPSLSAEVSPNTMLNIGQQIERIVEMLEEDNRESFVALTDRLRSTAEQASLEQIAEAASQASQRAEQDAELSQMVADTHEILSLCRSIRSVLCSSADDETINEQSVSNPAEP